MKRTMLSTLLALGLLPMVLAETRAGAAERDELKIIRERYVAELLETAPDDAEVARLLETIRADGSWPGIDYKDVSRTGFQHAEHLANMRQLSLALRHPDSTFHQAAAVRNAALTAFDFWVVHDFICDNWWWNEMGTPRRMVDILLLLDDALDDERRAAGTRIVARARVGGVGARPGGDFIQIGGIMAKRALFERDAEAFARAMALMEAQVEITTGRGVKPDLSLQHRRDRVTSTLTYGRGYASSFADLAAKVHGTRFAFSDAALELVVDFYLDGIHRSMAHGRFPDPQQLNRGITRMSALGPIGPSVPEGLAAVSNYRRSELETLIAVRRGEATPDFRFNKFFWSSEYFTHQRPGYFASVRMYSTRNHSMEQPYNEEGLKNHYLADGSNFLIQTGDEYVDLPPVYDWRKIPGTTVLQKPDMPPPGAIQQRGRTDFVGGVSDGLHGAAAFDFESPLDGVRAKKAWFFFDDQYVCLGSGIRCEADHPVATTLNQTRWQGDIRIAAGDRHFAPERGEHVVPDTHWVWHDGVAYLFPEPAEARLKNNTASGTWRSINRQRRYTDETVEEDVFTLWLDHGRSPRDGWYAYRVIPGIAADRVADAARRSPVTILANTPELQAVAHAELGLALFAFYEPGAVQWAPGLRIAVEQPVLVLIATDKGRIARIAVADPARKHDVVCLTVSAPLDGAGEHWTADWDAAEQRSDIRIDLPTAEYAGQTRMVKPVRMEARIGWRPRRPVNGYSSGYRLNSFSGARTGRPSFQSMGTTERCQVRPPSLLPW